MLLCRLPLACRSLPLLFSPPQKWTHRLPSNRQRPPSSMLTTANAFSELHPHRPPFEQGQPHKCKEEEDKEEEDKEEEEENEEKEEAFLEAEDGIGVAPYMRNLEKGLYLVATPIGNLEDITLRALRVLKSVDLILTEDTRHSAKLLRHYNIFTRTVSYHKFNEINRLKFVMEKLGVGQTLALISDAGMPGVSDPGAQLVKACVERNIAVYPIPGACAVVTALAAAGFPTTEFSFVGFLPTHASQRLKRLMAVANEAAAQIVYVPPHKLCKVLDDCKAAFGPSRRCVIAREMTKIHEEFWRGTIEEAHNEFLVRIPRGEITLVVEGLEKQPKDVPSNEEIEHELQALLTSGKSVSEAVRLVAEKTSARRKLVYGIALKISPGTS